MVSRTLASLLALLFPFCLRAQQEALPVVKLWGERVSTSFSVGRFLLLAAGDTLIDSRAELRHRGASSLAYGKKSFAVKLQYDDGEKRNAALLGMRNDNYWILDAAAIDMSRMRNRVAMDLWLDFSRRPESFEGKKAVANGTRGQFVELYFNDRYNGLYCLSERIDRKQLGLQKADDEVRGCLAKAVQWNSNTYFSASLNLYADDAAVRWGGLEAKYPDLEEGEPWSWRPFTEFFDFAEASSLINLALKADEVVDMPVLIDYALLLYLIEAEDNVAKNYYLAHRDITDNSFKWFVTPWDMDHSFGRRYDSVKQSPEVIKVSSLSVNVLLRRLGTTHYGLERIICDRYAELRSTAFSLDSLVARFDAYADLFESSGAWQRERTRWLDNRICPPPLFYEMKYIKEWIAGRLEAVDALFGYKPEEPNAVTAATVSSQPQYYNLHGIPVSPASLRPGTIYIYRDGKSTIKTIKK